MSKKKLKIAKFIDPYDKDCGFAKFDGDTFLGTLVLLNGSVLLNQGFSGLDITSTVAHCEDVLKRVVEWWSETSFKKLIECFGNANGEAPEIQDIEKLEFMDSKFAEDLTPDKDFGYASINGSAIMMLLSMCNGVFHCDLGFSNRVNPEHQAAAKKALLDIIQWWKTTPQKEIEKCWIAHQNWLSDKFNIGENK